jgi:hypothetical protein
MLSTFKKDLVKGLLYNRFYGYFLIYTESSISVWSSFTGLKMFGFYLTAKGQPVSIGSLEATACFSYSLTQYIVSADNRIFYFDLIDGETIQAEVQGRMLMYPKQGQDFSKEITPVTHIEGDFQFQRWTFSSSYIRSHCLNPNSK